MANTKKKHLSTQEQQQLLILLKNRFEKHKHRHATIEWNDVALRLVANPDKLWSLYQMEETGGDFDSQTGAYLFCDCAAESPQGRRSVCYDREGLESRKENRPANSAQDMAAEMGIDLLTEEQYHALQQLDTFDTKTSSWLNTPANLRKLGGALFGDFRYGRVFIYHNGAQSYYAARAFRGLLKV
ncbi:MAG: DUF4256 domain-containing protein [Bacteroidetes bacterium]|nr:MAG: DUF4256 domain-containing protein [Bacteroidota bacterium]